MREEGGSSSPLLDVKINAPLAPKLASSAERPIHPSTPGRDSIVTRMLLLRGQEPQNQNAYGRYIYIHGTPEERNIGFPVSYGCVRMRSRDIVQLYDTVGLGAEVTIVNTTLHTV